MRLPRYQQQEQYTSQGSGVFQQERLVSPLETIGTLGANILEESVKTDYNAWIQSQAATAQTKIYELADDFTNRIQNDEILDSKSLDDEFTKSINDSIDSLQLSPKARKQLEPDIVRLQGLQKVQLGQTLRKRRGEWEAQSINDLADRHYQEALTAKTNDDFLNAVGLLKGVILSTEGTFVTQDKRDELIRTKIDGLMERRIKTLAQDPTIPPEELKKVLDSVEVSGELYGNLNYIIENRTLAENEDDVFFGINDLLEEAKANPNFDTSIIRSQIEANKTVLGRPLTMSLSGAVEGLENERKRMAEATGTEKARIIGEMAVRKSVIDGDYDGAIAYLNENRSAFENESDFLDAETRILAAKKSALDDENTSGLMANVPVFTSRVIKGEFNNLNSDQFKALVDTEILVNKTLPKSSRYQLQQSFEMQKLEAFNDQQEIEQVKRLASLGIRSDNEKAVEKLWNSVPEAHNDTEAFKSFIDTYGSHKFHYDNIKTKIFDSKNDGDYLTGVQQGIQLWFSDAKKFEDNVDDETKKALFWSFNEIRRFDQNDYIADPNDPKNQIRSDEQNVKNAKEKVMKRLFPDTAALGLGQKTLKDVKADKISAVADSILDNVFPRYGSIKQSTIALPALNTTLKSLYGIFGSSTPGTRSQAGYSVFDSIPPIPEDARQYMQNLTIGKVLDGVSDPNKAAELSIPEFLETYGLSRLGTHPDQSQAYWSVSPPEWHIGKMYSADQVGAKQNAIEFFQEKVYERVLDITSKNPIYKTDHFFKIVDPNKREANDMSYFGIIGGPDYKAKKTIPPVRLFPLMNTLDQPMPDYYLTYLDADGNITPLMENGEKVVLKGLQMTDLIRKYADQYGYEKGKTK